MDKIHLKPDLGGELIVHCSIKQNKMNTHGLIWIFVSNNEIIHVMYLILYTGNQLWWQNIDYLKKIEIMDILQIVKAELNEITWKRCVGPCFWIYTENTFFFISSKLRVFVRVLP